MTYPKFAGANCTMAVRPQFHAYVQTDSRAANLVMRLLGPTAPKLAQEGAEQLLYFFNGPARYLNRHPEKADTLLGPAKK